VANVQLAMSNTSGTLPSYTNIAIAPIRVTSVSNAIGTAQPGTLIADSGAHTSTITFFPVLDSYGNLLPDGSRVLASANYCAGRDRAGACIPSDGGQILDGAPANQSGYKGFTVQNGTVTVTYSDQNESAIPGQIKTVNVVLMPSNSNGSGVSSFTALGAVTVRLAGTTSAQVSASPVTLYADGADRRSFVTVSNIRDAIGQLVPDGTKIIATVTRGKFVNSLKNSQNQAYGVVQNGQVVFEYSSEHERAFNGTELTAVVSILAANQSSNWVGGSALANVTIRLIPAVTTAVIAATPVDLFAGDLAPHLSQLVVTGLVQSDGTPLPDGAKVNISAAGSVATMPDGSATIASVGGTILSAGTTPGDGTFMLSNSGYTFTVAGGQVRAAYSSAQFFYQVNQTADARVFVRAAAVDGGILSSRALAVVNIKLRGTTSATASGPSSLGLNGGTGTVTFSGIRDSAGNIVPDGTVVAVGAQFTCAVRDVAGACMSSVGGTITDGTPSGIYKLFTVTNGSVSVTYSTAGASVGTARVYITGARADGVIGATALVGGIFPINITN
jgi:hypothetical protein